MKLKPIATNQTEIIYSHGLRLFFSYETPVACQMPSGRYHVTDKKWSQTTTRHINKWLNGATAEEMPQLFFDGIAE